VGLREVYEKNEWRDRKTWRLASQMNDCTFEIVTDAVESTTMWLFSALHGAQMPLRVQNVPLQA
jgi:hypothetical protein